MDIREQVIERIRKIMARTETKSGSTEAEIEQAFAFARKLMDDHNINEYEVHNGNDPMSDFQRTIVNEEVYARSGKMDPSSRLLLLAVSMVCDVKNYRSLEYRKNKRGNDSMMSISHYVGATHDVQLAIALFRQLVVTMWSMSQIRMNQKHWTPERLSYCYGFAQRLVQRAKEFRDAPSVTGGTAIVIRKSEKIEAWLDENVGRFKSSKITKRSVDSAAYGRGSEDADSVSLHERPQIASNQRLLK